LENGQPKNHSWIFSSPLPPKLLAILINCQVLRIIIDGGRVKLNVTHEGCNAVTVTGVTTLLPKMLPLKPLIPNDVTDVTGFKKFMYLYLSAPRPTPTLPLHMYFFTPRVILNGGRPQRLAVTQSP
jgi:hypothetical protein